MLSLPLSVLYRSITFGRNRLRSFDSTEDRKEGGLKANAACNGGGGKCPCMSMSCRRQLNKDKFTTELKQDPSTARDSTLLPACLLPVATCLVNFTYNRREACR